MLEVLVGGFVVILVGLAYLYATNKALHTKVDTLLGHSTVIAAGPAASSPPATVDHAGVISTALQGAAAIVAAAAGTPPVLAAPAAPVPAGIPLGPVGSDGKPTVVFPGGDLAAFRAFVGAALAQHGYGVTIVNTALQPLDVAGNVIAPVDSGDPASSFGPLDSFTAAYQHGRWTFQPNVAIAVPIKAPAGPYHIQCSGMGGAPGGDTNIRLAVTVKDASGAVVGSGDDNTYASFTSDGGVYTLDMVAPGATVEDVTLAPGIA